MQHRLKWVFLVAALVAAGPASARPVQSVNALLTRARAAEAAGRYDRAAIFLQSAVVADPARIATYVALGDFYARRDAPYFARKYYSEALTIDPTSAPALLGAGRIDLRLGDVVAAKKKLTRLRISCGNHCVETRALRQAIRSRRPVKADAASASLDKN